MYRLEYVVKEEDRGTRLDRILLGRMCLSAGSVRSLKFQNGILLDGVPAHCDRKPLPGQRVTAVFPDRKGEELAPVRIELRIPWEDGDLMAVDKPAPLASIRSSRRQGETLENALYDRAGCPEDFIYRPVNRLDKGTSGLMLVAKNAYIQQRMQSMLHSERFIRRYIALTDGFPPECSGRIDLPIASREGSVKRFIDASGKASVTDYRVLDERNGRALLLLQLHTGRTHQIRVHLAALGCPVAGDMLYGREDPAFPGRFALHSCYLSFVHPVTGEEKCLVSRPPFAEDIPDAEVSGPVLLT